MENGLVGLVGVLVGAGISVWLSRKAREYALEDRFLSERFEAYTALLNAGLIEMTRIKLFNDHSKLNEVNRLLNRIRIISPSSVYEAIREYQEALTKLSADLDAYKDPFANSKIGRSSEEP